MPSLRAAGLDPAALAAPGVRDYSGNDAQKRWKDIWAAGQGLDAIDVVRPTGQIVDQLEVEYRRSAQRFAGLAGVQVGV